MLLYWEIHKTGMEELDFIDNFFSFIFKLFWIQGWVRNDHVISELYTVTYLMSYSSCKKWKAPIKVNQTYGKKRKLMGFFCNLKENFWVNISSPKIEFVLVKPIFISLSLGLYYKGN